jgi:hypothetical protein
MIRNQARPFAPISERGNVRAVGKSALLAAFLAAVSIIACMP